MIKIGLLSDTHSFFPPQVHLHFADVDEIWHAGDIGDVYTADQLERFKPLRAVFGNIDGHELRIRYPENQIFKVENVTVLMTHIGGYPPKYNSRSLALIQKHKPHLFICGHSHILKIMPDPAYQLLHLNPGACGKQGWQKVNTLVKFVIDNDRAKQLEIIEMSRN